MMGEIIVEKTKENMEKAVDEEEKQRLGEKLISEKRLLNEFRQEERNHFLIGSFTDMEIWGDMSDEEEEDDEDNIEILRVTPNKVIRMEEMKTRMNDRDSNLEGFTDSDDEEMEEPVPEPSQGGKHKTRDDIVVEGDKHEEDNSDWKLVINNKKNAKEIKNTKDSRDNLKGYNTNNAENQRVSGKVANNTSIKQQGANYYAERSKGGITAKRDDKKLQRDGNGISVKVMKAGEKNVRIMEDDTKSGDTKKVLIADSIKPGNESKQAVPEIRSSLQRTITSYASAAKVVHNSNQIRFNFSFNVRVNNPSEWRRVAKILLEQSYEIDRKSFILPFFRHLSC